MGKTILYIALTLIVLMAEILTNLCWEMDLKQFKLSLYNCYILGGHTLSGACIETRALDELFPDWKDKDVSDFICLFST